MTIIGMISYKTASWLARWTNPDEDDISMVVNRILGKKWSNIFSIGSFTIMFCVGIVYF